MNISGPNGTRQSFAGESDYAQLQDLASTILELRKGKSCYATPGDLDWWYCRIDDPEYLSTVPIWRRNDQIVAFAWPCRNWPLEFFVDVFVHPEDPHLLPEVIQFGEAWCSQNSGGRFGMWAFDTCPRQRKTPEGGRAKPPR